MWDDKYFLVTEFNNVTTTHIYRFSLSSVTVVHKLITVLRHLRLLNEQEAIYIVAGFSGARSKDNVG